MSGAAAIPVPVAARVDADGRLVAADPPLAALHARAGGEEGGALAVPQLAAIVRLARRLGIAVSRAVLAADGDRDVDLWVRAVPEREGAVHLVILDWVERPTPPLAPVLEGVRDTDFLRADADWIWETDAAMHLLALAPAERAIGEEDESVGQPLTRVFRPLADAEGALPLLEAVALRRRFAGQPAEMRGGARVVLAGVPRLDGTGRLLGYHGSATRDAEAASPAPAAPAAPDAFGQRLGGALRAPLDRIIANADSIHARTEGPLRNDYALYAADIASAGRHLLALVDDLVDLQAIERPGFALAGEEIDLADVARRAAGLLAVRAAARGVRIDAPQAGESVPATGDFRRVLQILVNLIGNAVRYSPEGGAVWVRCEREGELAAVIVADQGKGIDAQDQARVFEKFERVDPAEPGGTGLGLYIARRLARAMAGDIALDSAPGQGARFVLTLPEA